MKVIFLDTNIFVHYRSFDQIDWPKLVQADRVRLIINPVNLRELNSIKDSPAHSWFRKRAKEVVNRISRYLENELNVQINEKVELLIEHRDPMIDFDAFHLDRRIPDDNLIAAVLMYRQEFPDNEVVLVTSDNGLTLLAKARPQSIPVIKLNEEFKLPDEPDLDREKIKELEKKIRELSSAMPELSLVFEDNEQHTAFTLKKPLALADNLEKEKRLSEIKAKYPKHKEITVKKDSKDAADLTTIEKFKLANLVYAEEEIARYNKALDKFYDDYAEYPSQIVNYENFTKRLIRLSIWLLNDGTTPAIDIDINMHFPDGFSLIQEEDLLKPPKEPIPPKLKSQIELMQERMQISLPYESLYHDMTSVQKHNVSKPKITRGNSYDVDIHVEKAKHKYQFAFSPLYIVFNEFETASSFQIEYSILAENLPSETIGKLHVVIEKKTEI